MELLNIKKVKHFIKHLKYCYWQQKPKQQKLHTKLLVWLCPFC